MTTGEGPQEPTEAEAGADRPNASPELQDAIRSIDAIGENAWGPDDDHDEPRDGPDRDGPDADPDAPRDAI